MKRVLLSLFVIGLTAPAFAEVTLMGGEPFKLTESMARPYQNCFATDPTEPLIKKVKESLIQKARITCQADVEIAADFDVLRRTCGEDRFDIAHVTVEGTFKCKEIQNKVKGIAYVVYKNGVGDDLEKTADLDAMGQCGSNIVRTSEYHIDGATGFSRVYYKFGGVRMMTTAEYECVK